MRLVNKVFSSNERTATVQKNTLALFLLKGISMLASFSLVPMTIGYVSPDLYGIWLTLSSILTWLSFLDIGFSQGLKNKLTEAIAKDDWEKGKSLVSTTYFMMVLIFVPLCVILEVLLQFVDWSSLLNVGHQYEEEIKQTMSVLVVFACVQMITNVLVSVIAAFQKVALSQSFLVIGNVLSLVAIFLLIKAVPPSLVVLTFALAAMPILVTIIASFILYQGRFRRVAPSIKYASKNLVREIAGIGYKFFLANVQVVIVYQSTNILISYVSSPTEVAQYNIAYKLLGVAIMVYTIITTPLWPAYTDAYAREDFVWIKKTRNRMGLILILSVLGCAVLSVCAGPIYEVWLNNQMEIPPSMTYAVALYISVYCWMTYNTTTIVAMSKMTLHVCLCVTGMLLHIPLSLCLGHYWGAIGVLASLVIINTLYAAVLQIQVGKLIAHKAQGIWNR